MSLDVRGVTVSFGNRTVLDDVSFVVPTATTTAVVGPSGSGKSTLLRVIAGLQTPDRGRIVLDDTDITDLPTHGRRVGMVFQDNQLFPHLDVAGNIGFGMRMQHARRPEVSRRVTELLEMIGLADRANSTISELSGGEAKRVALARALAPLPRVLLLDEPLTGLDPELHDRLVDELRRILLASGITAILVTHDANEAAALAVTTVNLSTVDPS